ncbi:hypothetical protein PHLCEN_2v4282 [Hermanssonia centrifuga]|uniref:Uncharacterized protein n=1 Tax=Hermanssonia centrifuga TaxID=98765 RepID=A0A2R6PVN6_9APHY|nr:hypothetical protein PHLCEN_2v4282 [Hermanssonia centrifuga]
MSDASLDSTIYDDSSDQIRYIGPWYPIASSGSDTYNSTMSGLNEPASFSLSFLGSQVSVYGGVQHEEENLSVSPSISSAYSIDNVVIDTYNIVMPTGSDEFGVLFFTSGDLGASDHQLSVNITYTSPTFPYWLDYIIVSSPSTNTSSSLLSLPSTNPSSPLLSSPSTNTPNPLLSSTGSVHIHSLSIDLRSTSSVPVPSSTKSPIPSNSATPSTPVAQAGNAVLHTAAGLIAGSVIGGILLLCLLLGSLFLWRRARKEIRAPDEEESME